MWKRFELYEGHWGNFRSEFPMDHYAVTVDVSECYQKFISKHDRNKLVNNEMTWRTIGKIFSMTDLINSLLEIVRNSPNLRIYGAKIDFAAI